MLNDWTDYEDEKRRLREVYIEDRGGVLFWIVSTALMMGLLIWSSWPASPQPAASPSGPPAGITITPQKAPHDRY